MDYRTRNKRFEKERLVLDKIFDLIPVGQETIFTNDMVYQAFTNPPVGTGQFSRYTAEIEKAGILHRRYTMAKEGNGKVSFWTLKADRDQAHKMLRDAQDSRLKDSKEQLSESMRKRWSAEPETTVAIVGPDAPTIAEAMPKQVRDMRKDETGALIEAARQYANRKNSAMGKLQELAKTMEELGIKFDADKAAAAMHFEEDERLEAIALVLPYVDRLERVNDALASQVAEMRPKVAKYDQLASDNERLTNRVERLVSQQVMSTH